MIRTTKIDLVNIPQIAPTNLSGAERVMNELGADGYEVSDVQTFGFNNRFAMAGINATVKRWEYKLVAFHFKNPSPAQQQLNQLGHEGWELVTIYSQGVNNHASAAVLKRCCGDLLEDELGAGGAEDNAQEAQASGAGTELVGAASV